MVWEGFGRKGDVRIFCQVKILRFKITRIFFFFFKDDYTPCQGYGMGLSLIES